MPLIYLLSSELSSPFPVQWFEIITAYITMATVVVKAHRLSPDLIPEAYRELHRPRVSSSAVNYLSPEIRPAPAPIDDEGPGQLSRAGPRHDNDHISIRDIQILPTADEILAVDRPPYLPKKDLQEPHYVTAPMLRLLDMQFRHLRYDQTEYIRDICYEAAQLLAFTYPPTSPNFQLKQETARGNRYFLYRDVHFEEIISHERRGLVVRVSFACPGYLRGRRIHTSGRLQERMLCAIVSIDGAEDELVTTFFEIHLAQSTDSMNPRGGDGMRAAVQLTFAQPDSYADVYRVTRYVLGLAHGKFALVEFPRALFDGFYWCLKRLQDMNSTDVAFANHIAPSAPPVQLQRHFEGPLGRPQPLPILPPAYTTRDDFLLDLSAISSTEARVPSSALGGHCRSLLLDFLGRETTLDEGQAVAFSDSVSRELAFTQGPPGTGKTYLGIALARTILASRIGRSPKPILVVCLTNHALDSFLGGLIEAGEKSIARIGGGSREEWAQQYTVRNLSKKVKFNDRDIKEKMDIVRRARGLFNRLSPNLGALF